MLTLTYTCCKFYLKPKLEDHDLRTSWRFFEILSFYFLKCIDVYYDVKPANILLFG